VVSGKTYVWDRGVVYAPDASGVYALFDGDKCLLFVGGSENLRETFSESRFTRFKSTNVSLTY